MSNAAMAFDNQEPSSEERPNVERLSKAERVEGLKGRRVEHRKYRKVEWSKSLVYEVS